MFALLAHQSFVRPDAHGSTATDAVRDEVRGARPDSALPSVIPSARGQRRGGSAPGAWFTPAGGSAVPSPSDDLAVLVVDGDPQRREVLTCSLSAVGANSLSEAGSSHEARARARSEPCDLAVVDLALPDGGALELVGDLQAQGWRTVVLGGPDDASTVQAAFRAGALAYLLTSPSSATPGTAASRSETGDAAAVAARSAGSPNAPYQLSAREVQVLQCVADGQSNAEIGEELTLSALTVKSHLARIGRKLGTGDRAGMVAVAMRATVVH